MRNINTEKIYDIIVIGGGITGSGIALDSTLRGLDTLLLEKGDFASGTSSKSGKLVHGGLRYLEKGHFKLVFEACHERYNLSKIVAPHIVKPTMFFLPNYKNCKNPKWLIMLGVCAYSLIAIFRNIGQIKLFNKKQALNREKAINENNLTGGVGFYDCKAHDSRLVIDVLKKAKEKGSQLLNYCEVKKINLDNEIKEIVGFDKINNKELNFKARLIINATGVWADDIIKYAKGDKNFNLKKTMGVHIILPRKKLNIKDTIAFESKKDRRSLYMVPWRKVVLVGTTDTYYSNSCDELSINPNDIEYLLESVQQLFPYEKIQKEDIIAAFVGVRPLIGSNENKKESDMSRDFEVIVDNKGLLSISGGKLTTYRLMAKKIVNLAYKFLKKPFVKSSSLSPISGGDIPFERNEPFILDLINQYEQSENITRMLFARYGSNAIEILKLLSKNQNLSQKLSNNIDYLYAEIDYIVENEFIETVSDILMRRTPIYMIDEKNGLDIIEDLTTHIGKKLNWNKDRIEANILEYKTTIFNMRKAYSN